ncbi:unnamed protein product [Ixodes pacificus]
MAVTLTGTTGLLVVASLLVTVLGNQVVEERASRIRRQTINVHQIPKTSFSCLDKSAGEYYADPETGCQVYHICVPGHYGKLSKMSFACPNGTIFSQSSRVCTPSDRVYCALAERFYENVMGTIDTDKDYYDSFRADAPVFNAITPAHERPEKRRRPVRPVETDYDEYDTTTAPPAPSPTPRRRTQQTSNSRRFQSSSRGTRPQAPSRIAATTTTSTTTTTQRPPAPAFRPPAFRSPIARGPQAFTPPAAQPTTPPVVLQPVNAFSAAPPQPAVLPAVLPAAVPANPVSGGGTPPVGPPSLPLNALAATGAQPAPAATPNAPGTFRLPQRPQLRRPGVPTTTTVAPVTSEYEYYDYEEEQPKSTRTRRAIPVKVVLPPGRQDGLPQTSFTCQDKLAGGVYADQETDCQLFHICVPIGKGKLLDYGLLCEEGTAFNQETGTCDERDTFSCLRNVHFAKTDKTKAYLANKKPWATAKSNKRVIRDVQAKQESSAEEAQEPEEFVVEEVPVELPLTSFTCQGRTVGGYYADVETGCRMFHICAQTDMRFLCTNGTVFDQRSLVCKNEDQVSCEDAPKYYVSGYNQFLELEKYRPQEEAREQSRADSFESTKTKNKYPKKVGDFYKTRRVL